MPSLIFLLALLGCSTWAATAPELEVSVKLHHSRQWTKVFREGDKWYCATEHNPRFPMKGRPSALALFHGGKAGSACREHFIARKTENGQSKLWAACRTDARQFLDSLGRDCGRF